MTIADNRRKADLVKNLLSSTLPIKAGVNKINELTRLVYEVSEAWGVSPQKVLEGIDLTRLAADGKGGLFHRVKGALLEIRCPSREKGDIEHIMPVDIREGREHCPVWDGEMAPRRIFLDGYSKSSDWAARFTAGFPEAEVCDIKDFHGSVRGKGDRTDTYNSRRDNIFLVRNKAAFVKICPCTKRYKRCGYWILNVGFGCPIDCSYCYLQTYSNAPGIVLPSNIEEYFPYIEAFDRKLKARTRIGTGEFTDSLALDRYTGYSRYIIPFFSGMRNLVLELKTKVSDIDNVLGERPHDNVVISWSVNTPRMAGRYEKGAAPMEERISAALAAARAGYKIGFHFDPIVYYNDWKKEYGHIIGRLFSREEIRRNTVWISLGTLRYTPGLEQAAEQRFDDNLIYYTGEFFLDTDGKMRYKRSLRREMYAKMRTWIRETGVRGWIYLCMEPGDMWREVLGPGEESGPGI